MTLPDPYLYKQYVTGEDPNAPSFIKYHLAMSVKEYRANIARGLYQDPPSMKPLRKQLLRASQPESSEFLYQLQRVGENYGWHRRHNYQRENMAAVEKMIRGPETQMYIFQVDGREVGFCLITGIREEGPDSYTSGPKRGAITKKGALGIFKDQKEISQGDHIRSIEINKIGIYPEFTGRDYGDYFLPRILNSLYETYKYDIVYLDTRSTNPEWVLRFWERHGFVPFHSEELPSDLVDARHAPDFRRTPRKPSAPKPPEVP